MLGRRETTLQEAIPAILASQADPIGYIASVLRQQRVPPQGTFFNVHTIIALIMHSGMIICVSAATWTRYNRQQLWFTRRQQGRLRLNATVIAMLISAAYSSTVLAYTALLIRQQSIRRYIPGSAAFQLSCFSAVSLCVSVIAYTYHQSLPVGFENSLFRLLWRKKHAAMDRHFFSFSLLCIWMIVSLASIMISPIIHDYWRRKIDDALGGVIDYLDRPQIRAAGTAALAGLTQTVNDLEDYNEKATHALRNQLLLYIGHASLFTLIIAPVVLQLITLLNDQIGALTRNAEDFFRLGSRVDLLVKSQVITDPLPCSKAWRSPFRLEKKAPRHARACATTITCQNCNHEVAVSVTIPAEAHRKDTNAEITPEAITSTYPSEAKHPRFKLPTLPSHAESPLSRIKKLQRARFELLAFSIIIIGGLLNFLVWCLVLYIRIPHWSSSQVQANLYVACFWCYLLPGLSATILYAYMTWTLSNSEGSVSSAPTSRSAETALLCIKSIRQRAFRQRSSPTYEVARDQNMHHEDQIDLEITTPAATMLVQTKRSQPSFPRAPSSLATIENACTENLRGEGGTQSPNSRLRRSTSQMQRWLDQHQDSHQSQTVSGLGHGHQHSKSAKGSMPVSQTMSWLELDEGEGE